MKKPTIQTMTLAAFISLLGLTSTSPLAADPTTTVRVYHHLEFRNGKYVNIPTYDTQAPQSKSRYSRTEWLSPGYVRHQAGYQSGHWSRQTTPTPSG